MAGRAIAEPDAIGPATVDDACDESAAEDGDELLDEQAARDKATATPIEQLTSGIGHGDLIGTSTISQATFPHHRSASVSPRLERNLADWCRWHSRGAPSVLTSTVQCAAFGGVRSAPSPVVPSKSAVQLSSCLLSDGC